MEQEVNEIIWQDRKHYLWFPISFTKYTVKNNRLFVQRGFFNSQLDETLLYRIVDFTMKQSLLGKLFGTGDIVVTSRVDTELSQVLENIKNPKAIYELLSDAVEESRKKQNVVGKEFYGSRGTGECDGHHEGVAFNFDESGHERDGEF